jgi:glycosyltransferase involved in cell wall biosynthesis
LYVASRKKIHRMTKPLKICIIGDERSGWALDIELKLTRNVIDFAEFTHILNCNVIHAVNWPSLARIPKELLLGKRVIAHLTHDPQAAVQSSDFDLISQFVNLWIMRSHRARQQFDDLGLETQLIPYIYDTSKFYPLPKHHESIKKVREDWNIPKDCYLIGSFQRDTEGKDLITPKLVKGPDIFAEIIENVWKRRRNIHVLLTGPRRFWLRQRLSNMGIPFTFIGRDVSGDDLMVNILPQEKINVLYNLIDLYLVSSRLEGGPQAVIEAAATKCKILSSNVGHAPDILDADCIYENISTAVQRIERDIDENHLTRTLSRNFKVVQERHSPDAVQPQWASTYDKLMDMPVIGRAQVQDMAGIVEAVWKRIPVYYRSVFRRFFG